MYTVFQRCGIYTVEFYQTKRGECPAKEFMESLPERVRAKVAAWIGLLQERGQNLHRPYADTLEGPIRELRVSHGRLEIRILYFMEGKAIVLTHGFYKKTRDIPKEEIEKARRIRIEWMEAEHGGEK